MPEILISFVTELHLVPNAAPEINIRAISISSIKLSLLGHSQSTLTDSAISAMALNMRWSSFGGYPYHYSLRKLSMKLITALI
jgi:hypothetical protein